VLINDHGPLTIRDGVQFSEPHWKWLFLPPTSPIVKVIAEVCFGADPGTRRSQGYRQIGAETGRSADIDRTRLAVVRRA
jgi:hypothetical protein